MIDSFQGIVQRIKEFKGLRWNKDVALALGTTPNAFEQYRRRGAPPLTLLRKFAAAEGVSVYWLLTGNQPPPQEDVIADIVVKGLRRVVRQLKNMETLTPWEQRWVSAFRNLDAVRRTRLLAMAEGMAEEMGRRGRPSEN